MAGEPPSAAPAAPYTAKVKFLRVDGGKQIIAVDTQVAGVNGKPLTTALAGKNGLTLKVKMEDVRGGTPTQYVAQFKLVEIGKDGKERVLSEPALVTTAGRPAKLMVGQEKGDRIEVEVVVAEGISAASQPKAVPQEQANRKRPSAVATSSLGTSLMITVHPRLIIQEEEEERMGVVSPP